VSARFPLTLVTTQPASRLHSQLDAGSTSRATKVRGLEPVLIHAGDARGRGIRGGDVVEVRSDRGACLAGAVVTTGIAEGCAQMATGAWYLPERLDDGTTRCANGNVNAVTRDIPTSRLAQACAGVLTAVQISRVDDDPAPTDKRGTHESR
jgi:biotin/methionine sulfoxide reductase